MSDSQTVSTARPDVDIHADVQDLIQHYPPLAADHHQIRILVTNGVVHFAGHVKSQPSHRYLLDAARQIKDVTEVNGAALYDEDTLRLEVAKQTPMGVQVNVRYGTVILTGELPAGMSADELVETLARVPGVERVVTNL